MTTWDNISGGPDTSPVSAAVFLVKFPEFAGLGDENMIAAHLADAENHVHRALWGKFADEGVMWWAAHTLACTPFGQNAKLQAKDGYTVYLKQFDMLVRKVTSVVAR